MLFRLYFLSISFIIGILVCSSVYAQESSLRDVYEGKYLNQKIPAGQNVPLPYSPDLAVLYDNGPLVTHPGGGSGGADASALQTTLGLGTYGFGQQISAGNTVADDFTVPVGGWQVGEIQFFTYQTGSTTASTINDVRVQIWNGAPNAGGTVIFGDLTTNRLSETSWTNIYRVLDTQLSNTQRPVMRVVVRFTPALNLAAGTYWVEWQCGGTLASGPWAAPVSILGATGKPGANALQKTTTGWAAIVDATFPQDLPFVIYDPSVVNDVGTLSVDVASSYQPGLVTPKATVKNFGTTTQTFNVQMTITGGYSSTKSVTSLAPGVSQQVTFDNWNATLGEYVVNVCTQLAGDANASNDCLSKNVGVYSGAWTSGANFPTTTYLGSGVGTNGALYSFGGNTSSLLGTECYKYDVSANTWSPIASLPAGRRVHTTAVVGNFIYAIGGSDMASVYQSTVYRYDISGNSWSTVAPLPVALGWVKAVGYNNSKIYVAGGVATGDVVVSTVYVYDVGTDTWATATSMPSARFGGAFSVTGNKLVYVGGADLTLINNTVYVGTIDGGNPALITWTTMDNPYPGVNNLSHSVSFQNLTETVVSELKPEEILEAAAYPPGAMYRFDAAPWGTDGIIVASGSPSANWVPADPNPCYVYKPATDTWTKRADVPIPVLGASLGTVNNGSVWKLIVASGLTLASIDTNATQIWTDNLGGASTFQLSINLLNGWNMVSVPGTNPNGMGVANWWPGRVGDVYKYAGGYQTITTATPGVGYWMKNNGAQTYNTGDEWPAGGLQVVAHTPLTGAIGWNMIGGYEIAATASLVTTVPAGLQSGPIYKYAGGYSAAATIDPGFGYWIKLTGSGQIIIPETMSKESKPVEYFPENWGRIVITDAAGVSYTLYAVNGQVDLSQYELPPAPPTGMYDFRYESGRIAEDLSSSVKTIEMSGVVYPLTVRVEGMDIRLMDESGKKLNENLKDGESIEISESTIEKLMVSGELLPTVYSLEQNYPNPFNPSTMIEFSLPEMANVKLSIYNALGEKVAELVNTSLQAGKYQYNWNASGVATGMYIYELRTDNFVSVKKMLLLK
ncbi:MAG: T9SS type A sorting domain-containing protein [Ignavibacteriota bacterium]|nr:T9SS type A sorting domain-containing protein [Ignavibacteriales bacterium]QKJ97634.1 MAG: T9SS type A sorting domain-containing protein [Ignavibacteriota bacterium]